MMLDGHNGPRKRMEQWPNETRNYGVCSGCSNFRVRRIDECSIE
jgi:hypothetical protein